ncbi:MAG: large conductance mechanosensitive channel protein MscL [Oscillospiraceae bacterium]|nr:large conductance mechanosensitive channel protein MscL [Oscillospiraceae bacterium]
MKKFLSEFKAFIARGNVLDMAIGVIIATSFGKITTALVSNVLTPLLAIIFNSPNTDALNFTLRAAEVAADGTVVKEAIVLGLGTLLGAIIDFVVIAFVIFLIVKAQNAAHAKAEAKKKAEEEAKPAEPPKPTTEELLTEILAALKAK